MSESQVTLADQKLRDLYTTFQHERQSLGQIYTPAIYDDFVDRGRYQAHALLVTLIAQEHILSAMNAVNRFCYDLHSITAWSKVFEFVTEGEKMQALYEFLFPIASDALSA